MIKSREIRDALADLIKIKADLPLKVFFNHVNNSAESYVWIKFIPTRRAEGFGVFQRRIRVIFQVVLAPVNGEVRHTDLYDIAEKLDVAIGDYIQIKDRFITVYDGDARIFDGILTYEFMLDFTDCLDGLSDAERYEFMRELFMNGENWTCGD